MLGRGSSLLAVTQVSLAGNQWHSAPRASAHPFLWIPAPLPDSGGSFEGLKRLSQDDWFSNRFLWSPRGYFDLSFGCTWWVVWAGGTLISTPNVRQHLLIHITLLYSTHAFSWRCETIKKVQSKDLGKTQKYMSEVLFSCFLLFEFVWNLGCIAKIQGGVGDLQSDGQVWICLSAQPPNHCQNGRPEGLRRNGGAVIEQTWSTVCVQSIVQCSRNSKILNL